MLPVEASHYQPKLYVIEEYSYRMVCCESNDGLSIKSQQFLTIQKLSLGNAQWASQFKSFQANMWPDADVDKGKQW